LNAYIVTDTDECPADNPENENCDTASRIIYCCTRITVSILNIKKFIKLLITKTTRMQKKANGLTQLNHNQIGNKNMEHGGNLVRNHRISKPFQLSV
jgi:hypothetical protein